MPIELGIWRLGNKIEKIGFSKMESESRLEDILSTDISMLGHNLLLLGRQVPTVYGKFIDLLAMDTEGNLIVIELKKDKTPRDVVAQLLDYGSWIRDLEDEDIASIFDNYLNRYHPADSGKSLDEAFRERFGIKDMPETLNGRHDLLVVASELDSSTERIVNYLADEYGVAINAVYFRFFRDEDNEYLSRIWLIDPTEVDTKVAVKGGKEPWNGEFYVSFGEGVHRNWEDAVKYGFISAGGGSWYSQTLGMLEPEDRIWVNVPACGYVGVGTVKETVVPLDEFKVTNDKGEEVALSNVPLKAPNVFDPDRSEEQKEHFVSIEWIKTVPVRQAVKEKGFFGNQNTVAKPRTRKWSHTVERLKKRFDIDM